MRPTIMMALLSDDPTLSTSCRITRKAFLSFGVFCKLMMTSLPPTQIHTAFISLSFKGRHLIALFPVGGCMPVLFADLSPSRVPSPLQCQECECCNGAIDQVLQLKLQFLPIAAVYLRVRGHPNPKCCLSVVQCIHPQRTVDLSSETPPSKQ